MPLKLMYISNKPEIAKIAESCGVDRIFVDLEILGKVERQSGRDTVISKHSVDDIKRLRDSLTESQLFVRVNPVNDNTATEVSSVIDAGAEIIMLPYFKTTDEVSAFISAVGGRAKTCLLFETPSSVDNIDDILALPGIDEAYVGLNDLHLGYKLHFMFELLSNGTVELLCNKFREKGIPYGFGGVARLRRGLLPSERILAEHYRLGSTSAILSRSFCDADKIADFGAIAEIFSLGVREIRTFESLLATQNEEFFESNRVKTANLIENILNETTNM